MNVLVVQLVRFLSTITFTCELQQLVPLPFLLHRLGVSYALTSSTGLLRPYHPPLCTRVLGNDSVDHTTTRRSDAVAVEVEVEMHDENLCGYKPFLTGSSCTTVLSNVDKATNGLHKTQHSIEEDPCTVRAAFVEQSDGEYRLWFYFSTSTLIQIICFGLHIYLHVCLNMHVMCRYFID